MVGWCIMKVVKDGAVALLYMSLYSPWWYFNYIDPHETDLIIGCLYDDDVNYIISISNYIINYIVSILFLLC